MIISLSVSLYETLTIKNRNVVLSKRANIILYARVVLTSTPHKNYLIWSELTTFLVRGTSNKLFLFAFFFADFAVIQ